MARRVRRRFRGGRIVDLGGGHGLLAHVMLLLDDSSPSALVVDKALPPSSATLHDALLQAWPRLSGRVAFVAAALDDVEILPTDLVVSSHACGALTDRVLERAVSARARVAVLPCCHHLSWRTTPVRCRRGWTARSQSTSGGPSVCSSTAIASGRRPFPLKSRPRIDCCSVLRQNSAVRSKKGGPEGPPHTEVRARRCESALTVVSTRSRSCSRS